MSGNTEYRNHHARHGGLFLCPQPRQICRFPMQKPASTTEYTKGRKIAFNRENNSAGIFSTGKRVGNTMRAIRKLLRANYSPLFPTFSRFIAKGKIVISCIFLHTICQERKGSATNCAVVVTNCILSTQIATFARYRQKSTKIATFCRAGTGF